MSADGKTGFAALSLSICWGLLGTGGAAMAQEEEQPDLEFLEYLGSWEASDEDWIMLTEDEAEDTGNESKEEGDNDPSPDGEKLAELDNED